MNCVMASLISFPEKNKAFPSSIAPQGGLLTVPPNTDDHNVVLRLLVKFSSYKIV